MVVMPDAEETYPYCQWCGRYMGRPGVADHAQQHREDCRVVARRRQLRETRKVLILGDFFDMSAISKYWEDR